ncbi:hypothetical protein D5018_15185 [Parashewanella curva]|uniref:Uncharacterized protein n=1 Tax=Parashewanella curva TaxID=2338552 RepID=A0A3L8PTV1_9GAMM|nr:hypothetical protein [Parashewanella curva]RLV58845.1 hypothetical protein D5018_15185 [Parashewanella curva]
MNKKILVIVIVFVTLLGLGAMSFFKKAETDSPEVSVDVPSPSIPLVRRTIPKIENGLSTGVDMFNPQSPSQSKALIAEEKDTVVWVDSEEAERVLKAQGKLPADLTKEQYIELDLAELKALEVGDYVDLYIPQMGGSYTGEVDFIQLHSNGDKTIEANIPGAGRLYSAVITLGEEAVYGNLATQNDTYIVEGNGKYAWIASKTDLESKHSKEHNDAVIPNGKVEHKKDETFSLSQ